MPHRELRPSAGNGLACDRLPQGDILVVDDYRPLAEAAATVAAVVTGRGAQVCGPGETMQRLGSRSIALLIVNRDMKPTTGRETIARVRAARPDLPILMMGTQVERARARTAGADDGIATPFTGAVLTEVLTRMTSPEKVPENVPEEAPREAPEEALLAAE